MRTVSLFTKKNFWSVVFIIGFQISVTSSFAQLKITDFTLFSDATVTIGSSNTINGGAVGSNTLVQSTGNAAIKSSIYSGGKIALANSNIAGVAGGKISAANSANLPGTVISVGSSVTINCDVFSRGPVVIGGGTVSGAVTVSPGTYTGPAPAGGVNTNPFTPQTLPGLLAVTDLSGYPTVTTNITADFSNGPGNYGNINFGGNKTMTLNGPGIYVFNSITMTGNSNKLVFNFNNLSGNYYVYVKGNADFGKLSASSIKGGNASRIFVEVQGNGVGTSIPNYSFIIANGSSGGGSKWMGTLWVPNGGINIGSGTGSSTLTGCLYSSKQVNIQSGVEVFYAPFTFCTNPDANAGLDKPLDFSTQTMLIGTSTTPGVSFNWQAINGGVITTPVNNDTILVSVAGAYVLTVSSGNCATRDTVVVSSKIESGGGNQKNIIGSELQSIYDNRPQSSPFFFLRNDSVMIDVMVNPGFYNYILNLLQTPEYGLDITPFNDPANTVITNGTSNLIITGLFPIANLPKLNLLFTELNFCRPYYQAVNYTDYKIGNDNPVITGLISSAGDIAMRSNLVRKGYKINGNGFKVGILSNSFTTIHAGTTATQPFQPITNPPNPIPQTFTTNTAAQDVANGDLPGDTTFSWAVPSHVVNPNGFTKNMHVLKDFPVQLSDEGRAMAQIAHDVAPGAELFARTGFFTANDCAIGIKELKDAGCNIIVDDITYITEPFFKNGVIANAVDSVAKKGVSYFSAAGNFANKSYEGDFSPIPISSGPLAGKVAHNFGGNDMFQRVRLAPGDYTFVFQWIDDIFSFGDLNGTKIDCDSYIVPCKPNSLVVDSFALFGFNRNNTGGDPIEFIPFTIPAGPDSIDANILFVSSTPGLYPDRFKCVIYRGGARIMEFNQGNSTIVGQANAEGAITIGATRFDKTRPYLNTPQLESFSSIGRTKTAGVLRNKPDLVGPDGVNTTVKLGQDYPNTALDGFPNFFGTSAAAPHAASAAALIMEGRKKFLGRDTTMPSDMRSLLQSTAIDMATPGFDSTSGYGFINVDLAMRTFAAPTPSIDLLVIPVTTPLTIPGNSVFTVTVKGENFSSNSVLYYKDSALASTTILNTNEATAIMPKFEDNPGIRMYTPPYPNTVIVNGQHLDGGFSNTVHFFEGSITVNAANLTKKYAQQLPPLTSIIKINGVLLQDTTLSLTDIGLQGMTITTPATANSDVGTYIITPLRIFDENNPADVALLLKYHYSFTNGALTIEKLPLKVTPEDKTVTQGQYIGNVTFKYDFDHTNISDPTALINLIKGFHQSYVPNNVLAVIKNFLKTQANGSTLTTADLLNLNMIASFKAVKNSRKFQLGSNNELVPVSDPNLFNLQYLIDVASESIYNYKSSPGQAQFFNSYPGVNSTAVLGAAALNNDIANVVVNGSLNKLVNGSLEQTVNTSTGPMAPILNGSFVQVINGEPYPVPDGSLAQLANTSLIKLVNDQFVQLANTSLIKLVNGSLLKMVNGSVVQIIDGVETPIITNVTDISAIPNNSLVKLVNTSLVKMVNGSLQKIVNGSAEQILNTSLIKIVNNTLLKIVNGSTLGLDPGTTNNNTAVIVDQSDVDPLQANWLGAMLGINMITGLDVGTQWLVPGVLVNSNFDISYGLGKATITANPCTIAHSLDKSFGSSANPGTATSLWLSMVTKVSGQLKAKGDYLLFKSGTVTFNNISSTPAVTDVPLPTGKIVADNVSVPSTKYDAASDTWTTKVPIGFSSTSDIFVTGVIINSSNGFVKNNNASTSLKGMFYSNKTFKDQWAYQSAAYQPQFSYTSIADSGKITSINGTYRAGTPTSQLTHLVNGGSGGGGNNYTGSTNSFDKFTACVAANSPVANQAISLNEEEIQDIPVKGEVQIIPNPATNYISLSFVPTTTGNSKIVLFTIDGKKVFETNNGVCEAGIKYMKKIDVSKLTAGVYLVQLKSNDKLITKKIIIGR